MWPGVLSVAKYPFVDKSDTVPGWVRAQLETDGALWGNQRRPNEGEVPWMGAEA